MELRHSDEGDGMNCERKRKIGGRRVWAALAALGALAGLTACGGDAPGMMVHIPPPAGWEEGLASSRAERDRYFATSPETPLLAEDVAGFEGLDYWEPDPDYYYVGQVHLYLQPERFEIVTTSGVLRPCEKVGWLGFEHEGQPLRLQVYRLLDQRPQAGGAGFFVPFMDATSGQETYSAGRYVELYGPEGGPYVLDFNTAHNPWCAYGAVDRYVCPVTPPENRLPVRIEAGERGYRHDPSALAGDEVG
jgi:uncharacterized protein (DUF1684 family)